MKDAVSNDSIRESVRESVGPQILDTDEFDERHSERISELAPKLNQFHTAPRRRSALPVSSLVDTVSELVHEVESEDIRTSESKPSQKGASMSEPISFFSVFR